MKFWGEAKREYIYVSMKIKVFKKTSDIILSDWKEKWKRGGESHHLFNFLELDAEMLTALYSADEKV